MGRYGFHTFPKGISLKVKLIAQMEFELDSYFVVQHINHHATRT